MEKPQKLKFGKGNAKLGNEIYTFSLPAGHSCPGAMACLSKADPDTGRITDGKKTQFRCFAASQEANYTTVRAARWYNYMQLLLCKTAGKYDTEKMKALLLESLPEDATKVRIHVSGDFFAQEYFNAWLAVAEELPEVIFYAYTKSLRFWVNRLVDIPVNLRLTASRGGSLDRFIDQYMLPEAQVIFHPDEAGILEIDHDDSHAWDPYRQKFALLLHGTQPLGTEAAAAMSRLRAEGHNGYSRKKSKFHGGSHVRQEPVPF